jgi:hypothetical protein
LLAWDVGKKGMKLVEIDPIKTGSPLGKYPFFSTLPLHKEQSNQYYILHLPFQKKLQTSAVACTR